MSGEPQSAPQPRPATGQPMRQVVTVANPQGLHMRPASVFAKRAREFSSEVKVIRDERPVNGKSQLDLLLLAAEPGVELTIEVLGDDAAHALEVLSAILSDPGELEAD